jgi:hypothetical protein
MSLTTSLERANAALAAASNVGQKLDTAISEHVARQVDAAELLAASQRLEQQLDDAAALLEIAAAHAADLADTPTPDAPPVATLDAAQAALL